MKVSQTLAAIKPGTAEAKMVEKWVEEHYAANVDWKTGREVVRAKQLEVLCTLMVLAMNEARKHGHITSALACRCPNAFKHCEDLYNDFFQEDTQTQLERARKLNNKYE